MKTPLLLASTALTIFAIPGYAAPSTYQIDPAHTYASFAATHIPGGSHWRGKFDRTEAGTVILDPAAGTGRIDVVIDTRSVDFGYQGLNETVRGPGFLDSARYPTAEFRADAVRFDGDRPVAVMGSLTLHGITRPLTLQIKSFNCMVDPFAKVQRCGADAFGTIDRSAFGISSYAQMTGGSVQLEIQAEGLLQGGQALAAAGRRQASQR